jgi:hypothetical protein
MQGKLPSSWKIAVIVGGLWVGVAWSMHYYPIIVLVSELGDMKICIEEA